MARPEFDVLQIFHDAVALKRSEPVLFAIFGGAPFASHFAGVKEKDFYWNTEIKLQSFLKVQEAFPEAMLIPGIYAHFGQVVEVSGFGGKVVWHDEQPPWAYPVLENIAGVKNLRVPDPKSQGIMPQVLAAYKRLWELVPKKYVQNYGYLDGVAHCMGPLEVAGYLRGYSAFFLDMADNPGYVHQLLEITTEAVLKWLHAQEEVNGPLKRLLCLEHSCTQISRGFSEEFFFPYVRRVFQEFPGAIGIYHNEGYVGHVIDLIPTLGAKIFHFGDVSRTEAREALGGKICLMGNINAIQTLLSSPVEKVIEDARDCLDTLAPAGGFILSAGGGMAPNTPPENIRAMIEAGKKWKLPTR